MATIRAFAEKKKTIPTSIDGLFIKALTISESKQLADQHAKYIDDVKDPASAEAITMALFAIACDQSGEQFDEFKSYETIQELTVDEFSAFARAIRMALQPGADSEKKS